MLFIRLARSDDVEKEHWFGPFVSVRTSGDLVLASLTSNDPGIVIARPSEGTDQSGYDGPWFSLFNNWDTLEIRLERTNR